ncbi:MAG TPA: RNA polymerase-binding protein DksA [Steroidobacteraceae bacterium]|nr:RNA polymerase-binding protein DksA [Steroidobacteraceae bacterium]
MAGKKTAAKSSKPKRPAVAKPAARRAAPPPAPRKIPGASRATVAASSAKPAARSAKSTERPSDSGTESSRSSTAGHSTAHPVPAHPVSAHPSASRPAPPSSAGADVPRPATAGRALPMPDADEADSVEPGSLLAGPRNVKPYVAKRGEQYMSKEQLAHFQQILLNWKRDLMEEVDRTVSHMKDEAANFPDPNDRATQEEEFSLELRTRDRERKLIRKIEEALKRIEDGTYGYCLETGEEIGIKRLEARPVATLSIEAQERRERRERQYGDRDDRYR